jgi:serine/threonine-protein kinase
MAELHLVRAHDPEPAGRIMVVKRLHPKLAIDPEYVRMFLDEARIATALRHPNIVEVYESGEDAGQCYIAMEYLHGHDLRDAMGQMNRRHVPIPIEQALSIARSVAAGLDYTHERTDADGKLLGIVHRDVSPHNVLLTYDGEVKIVDFGVAKASIQLSRTRTGVLKGKVAYMAPEQAKGLALDRRSDLFCIGILLWEMTTGRWLFRRRTELDTLNAVVENRPPRPSRLVSGYPRDLEKLVMKTLSRSPDDRWATAGQLIEAIDELARRQGLTLGPQAVSALMATAFADELSAWRAAQSIGTSLGDHLVAQAPPAAVRSHDDEDDDDLPSVALGTVAEKRSSRRRRLWPVFAAVVAAAGIAAAGIAINALTGRAPPAEPGSTPAPVVAPAGQVPAAGLAAPLSVPVPAPPAPAPAPPAPAPATSAPAPAPPAPPAKPLVAKPPSAKPPSAKPPLTKHAEPAHEATSTPPTATAVRPTAAPSAEPAPHRPVSTTSKPTLEELDQVPP